MTRNAAHDYSNKMGLVHSKDIVLHLDQNRSTPLYRQIYAQLRELILQGALPAGARLPTSRDLARQNEVARVTVAAAYDQLEAEGYVTSRVGAGTFVVDTLTVPLPAAGAPFVPRLTRWGQRIVAHSAEADSRILPGRPAIDFGFGRSFPHIFPYDVWRRLLARYLSTDDTMLSRYGSAAGFTPLRQAVADYLQRLRGVHCTPEQVVIVSGLQQALDILIRLLLSHGDEVLVETPGYADAFELFRTYGARLVALPVDAAGFPVERIPAGSRARFAFVTPSNQFPRGGTMPLARRLALLRWARQANALILEDDYDGELRYDGHPLAALQGLDEDGRVVYLGTFSKVLFPALRLGYIVLPPALLDPFLQARQLVDRGAPTLTQAAVADFITEGHFERHLRRLRQEYGERRQTLVEALEKYLPGRLEYSDVAAGLHVMLYLPAGYEEMAVVQGAAVAGVGIYPGAPYHLEQPARPSILLGFSGLSQDEIVEGVRRLASVF
ncbi:MAG: PLP-dependent aminotransferase family protein [Chloroflexi bacterium]|nr:PLP-dependent aminotransferase family protein [Chloroflexota bacterium]MCI0576564.1 PLP-dependent aminotransferase family protein [Chloroflexota bacterium]MCI0643805.1 PLP-dependent aminotransferase family protein [Chloroflexota bacterium]MCI0726097.1 PLP-dependent aminotransferase family protein [Chloroflexota bacterium]